MADKEHEDLVSRFEQSQSALKDAVNGLSDEEASLVWLGHWGVREIVGHVAGWEGAIGEALEKMARGERPSVAGIDLTNTDGSNDIFAEGVTGKRFQEVLEDLNRAGERLRDAIRAMPDDRILEGKTGRRMIDTMIRHPVEHIREILEWRRAGG